MLEKKKLGSSKQIEALKFVLNFCGLWPKKYPRWLSVVYSFYSIIFFVIFLVLYDLSFSVYIIFLEDIQEATDNLCMTLTLITLLGKVLNFKIFFSKIQNLLRTAEEFVLDNDQEISLVHQRISFYNKLILFLYASANIAASGVYVGPFFSSEIRLPFLASYPFDWKNNYTSYMLLYMYQVIGMSIQASLNVGMDLFSAYLMYVGSIKLEILGARLETLSKFHQQGELNLPMDIKTERAHITSLVKCVSTYQRIWKFTLELQKCFTYGFLIQISFSAVVIGSVAYQLTNTSPQENLAFYVYLIMFLICVITQIALPCYFANEVMLKHENLTGSIFKCSWHFQSTEYRRVVIIFMELVKRKRNILVGNWFDLDLNLFVSIMNFAYRLYTLLA